VRVAGDRCAEGGLKHCVWQGAPYYSQSVTCSFAIAVGVEIPQGSGRLHFFESKFVNGCDTLSLKPGGERLINRLSSVVCERSRNG
jgi:hypothetical protein